MINNKFTKITLNNKANYMFNYYKTKSKNVYIVKTNVWSINIQWTDFHCVYDFTLQLDPLVPNIEIWFNPKTCKTIVWKQIQQLILSDNSHLYQKQNETIKISNLSWVIYVWLFLFFFIFTLFILIKKYVKEWRFINYKW